VIETVQRPREIDDRASAILAAAEIVIDRFGPDKLSLSQIARVSLIPLARIYQYFADRNAVLGALSARALARLSGALDTRATASVPLDEAQRLQRVIDRFAARLEHSSDAYLVLCGPFDAASEEAHAEAVARLAEALHRALEPADAGGQPFRTAEALGFAAELVFACLRRSYRQDGRVTATSIEMAQHAVSTFVGASR
jgi:AcrR family transcriptional regulator